MTNRFLIRTLTLVLGLTLALSAATTSHAEMIAEDDFSSYVVGNAPNTMGGQGWQGRWHIGQEVNAAIEMAAGPNGHDVKCLRLSGGNTVRALIRRIEDSESYVGKPIYLRVVFEINNEDSPQAGLFAGWMFVDERGHRSNLPSVTTALQSPPSVRWGGDSKNLSSRVTPGQIHTLVGKLGGWDETEQQYTSVALWLDPDAQASEDAQPTEAEIIGSPDCKALELLFLRTYDFEDGFYRFFEVRLTTTWEDAVK